MSTKCTYFAAFKWHWSGNEVALKCQQSGLIKLHWSGNKVAIRGEKGAFKESIQNFHIILTKYYSQKPINIDTN